MKLIYNGVDIYPDISVNTCLHDMYSDRRSDTLLVRFNDTRMLWDTWKPTKEDTIEASEGAATTGKMFVTSIRPENGLFTLRAMSMPLSGETVNSKAWERVTFMQVVQEFASRHGLSASSYGVQNQTYEYLTQVRQSDFEFLQQRCIIESCAFLIYNSAIVVYGEPYMESQAATKTIDVAKCRDFEYKDNSSLKYGSAEVESGGFSGSYACTDGSGNRILRPRNPLRVCSNAEAARYAKGLIRYANKNTKTGSFWYGWLPEVAAGSVINLQTIGASSWNGKVFVNHIRHDYFKQESKVFFRHPLEGY